MISHISVILNNCMRECKGLKQSFLDQPWPSGEGEEIKAIRVEEQKDR